MSEVTFPTLLQGGLVLLASLTWVDAGRAVSREIYPEYAAGARHALVYAAIVTVLVLVAIWGIRAVAEAGAQAAAQAASTLNGAVESFAARFS